MVDTRIDCSHRNHNVLNKKGFHWLIYKSFKLEWYETVMLFSTIMSIGCIWYRRRIAILFHPFLRTEIFIGEEKRNIEVQKSCISWDKSEKIYSVHSALKRRSEMKFKKNPNSVSRKWHNKALVLLNDKN